MACTKPGGQEDGVHLEIFAKRLVLLVPAGIGIAPPIRSTGGYVLGGRCSYAARTRDPTGVIEVRRESNLRLGQFFSLWGQPLGRTRLASFHTGRTRPVLAFVDGRSWTRNPRDIRLRRHAEIVLEIGGFVRPHITYRFRKGL
ncbi:MAG: hypothetical protein C5B48_07075 [Candidatus Rokuibacteriota bacterium]|nr:MAG: hypothetical protein C5B48_07075 [Candidatus Rokubacteria bacterium]